MAALGRLSFGIKQDGRRQDQIVDRGAAGGPSGRFTISVVAACLVWNVAASKRHHNGVRPYRPPVFGKALGAQEHDVVRFGNGRNVVMPVPGRRRAPHELAAVVLPEEVHPLTVALLGLDLGRGNGHGLLQVRFKLPQGY